MEKYQQTFIEFSLQRDALSFGDFTLKSGRQSPYFFNAGVFNSGADLRQLGQFYAAAIENANLSYDALFGPAYKGIPLVTATAMGLLDFDKNIPYAFNRKEAKDHGEGGHLVGANIENKKVLIVDDVITAGTAIREVANLLTGARAQLAGVVLAFDRKERGKGANSATEEIACQYHVPIISIITMTNLIEYLEIQKRTTELEKMRAYRREYGV